LTASDINFNFRHLNSAAAAAACFSSSSFNLLISFALPHEQITLNKFPFSSNKNNNSGAAI
jgi:hypothetical protein